MTFQGPPVSFEEVAIFFSEEERALLDPAQKALHLEVMQENYETVASLDPHGELISRIALGEYPSELDEQLKEIEREIKDLLEFWEQCFVEGTVDKSSEIPWISQWHLGHTLDMKEESLQQDPSYNEEQVEQEALQDFLKALEEQRVPATCKQAVSQKQDRATSCRTEESPSSEERPTTSAEALANLSQGSLPALKKPITTEAEEVQEESGSPSSSSEEEEDTIRPKRKFLRCQATGMGKAHRGNSRDRNEQLQRCKLSRGAAAKQKVFRHHHQDHQQPPKGNLCWFPQEA